MTKSDDEGGSGGGRMSRSNEMERDNVGGEQVIRGDIEVTLQLKTGRDGR